MAGDVQLGYSGDLGKPEKRVELCTAAADGIWYPDEVIPDRML